MRQQLLTCDECARLVFIFGDVRDWYRTNVLIALGDVSANLGAL